MKTDNFINVMCILLQILYLNTQCMLHFCVALAPSKAKSEQLSLDAMLFVSISIHVGIILIIPEQIELQVVQAFPCNCQVNFGTESLVILYEYIISGGSSLPTVKTLNG